MNFNKKFIPLLFAFYVSQITYCSAQNANQIEKKLTGPSKTEIVIPIKKAEFRNNSCQQRVQKGNPRRVNSYFAFNGAMDGNRQVDPQIAVGGGFILHATNQGLIIYDKKGNYIDGVSQNCFNKGIDPKLFYDPLHNIFGFDMWYYWDDAKKKPVNIAISATSDPRGVWNIYPVSSPQEVDGGAIGYSKKWIGYSYPSKGENEVFIMKIDEAKAGKPVTVYHFAESFGQPVFTHDNIDDLFFLKIKDGKFVLTRVTEDENGEPVYKQRSSGIHGIDMDYPPKSPQKDTSQLTASGDRNPKNLILENGYLWFSQTINYMGNAAVQWNQLKLDGSIVQTGLISDPNTNYIETTLAVNKNNDVLVGFQETNPNMFISPRMAFRYADDPPGELRKIIPLGEGKGATNGVAWGDYSGTVVDGDNMTDLWTIQSIATKEGKGGTVIAKVPFE